MEQLTKRLKIAQAALKRLEHAKKNKYTTDQEDFLLIEEGLIQRFEYCYEVTWKPLQEHMRVEYSIMNGRAKDVFDAAFKNGMIDDADTKIARDMADARNNTSHEYNEDAKQEILSQVEMYYQIMQKIVTKIEQELR